MAKKGKTLAMRTLDAHKIEYSVYHFPDTIHNATEVAAQIGKPAEQVFKTLVVLRDGEERAHPLLVIVPGNQEINLRHLAHELGVKSVHMAGHDQAEKLTGLKVGGISSLALLNRPFDIYLDTSAQNFTEILMSAGERGTNLQLKVSDFLALTQAQFISTIPTDA